MDKMIPYDKDSLKSTAIFFEHQTHASLTDALALFEELEFDPAFIRAHAETFDESCFVEKIKAFVASKYAEHKGLNDDLYDDKVIGVAV